MKEVIARINGFQREGHRPVIGIERELIRCKDCKFYRQEIDMCDESYSTAHNVVHEDDFCSKAERKEHEVD